ncbi:helix-turn-helix domain-containing protein [uncultured Azohydromonas sp.]|uniref:IclR family transcriptional regulator n=1 Tax=uncultured Azohydromonas sp. TaxID=487342 RepID=UPI0026240B55|nr:helix-turn-helix domain-containing protein [uncultured Azohydromonas sp.]
MDSHEATGKTRTKSSGTGGTQAIARATALLREIANSAGGERSLAELARSLDIERPTAYRILRRLVEDGLAVQNPVTRGYGLGPLLFELGLLAKPPLQLQALAGEAATHIAHESGDTAFALLTSGLDSVCLDRKEGSYPVKALLMGVGRRRPLGIGASSLSMLAAMAPEEASQILDANAHRIGAMGESDVANLKAVVEQGRRDGFVLRAPVDAPEILSLGVAVRNAYGHAILGLSISALRFRIEQRFDRLLAVLRESRDMVETRLKAEGPARDIKEA